MLAIMFISSVNAAEPDYGFYSEVASILPAGKLTLDLWNSTGLDVEETDSRFRIGLGRTEAWLTHQTIGAKFLVRPRMAIFSQAGFHSGRSPIVELGAVAGISDSFGDVSLSGTLMDRMGVLGMQVAGIARFRLPIVDRYGPVYAVGEGRLRDHVESGFFATAGLRWVIRQQLTLDVWLISTVKTSHDLMYATPAAVRVSFSL